MERVDYLSGIRRRWFIVAVAVIAGMLAGVLIFGELLPLTRGFYESTARGAVTLPQLLGVPYGAVVCAVVAAALAAFAIAERIERRAGRRGGEP